MPARKWSFSQFPEPSHPVVQRLIFYKQPHCFKLISYSSHKKTHLPGYLEQSEALKTKGVSEIICISVNDPFVMSAWGKQNDAGGKVRMLADPVAAFTKEIDLAVDLPPLGGVRSKRYSMVVDNGIIKQLNVEPDNTGLSCSLANKLNI